MANKKTPISTDLQHFFKALASESKNKALPEEFNYFGKLIGSWKFNYVDNNTSHKVKGEWYFSWALEGMAVQDVIILPSRDTKDDNPHFDCEYGTTLRVYNPNTHAWDIAYCYTGKIIRLEARKQDGMIVLTNIDDKTKKWIFVKVEDNNFHWQNVSIKNDGEWYVNADLYAERV